MAGDLRDKSWGRITLHARKAIGYEPQDDSENRFADDIARLLHTKEMDA